MEFIDIILSLLALIALEVILGIDNLVYISILTARLPLKQRRRARHLGLSFAWLLRLGLLACAFVLTGSTYKLFEIAGMAFSLRDLLLLAGGIFLITKATQEIHDELSLPKTSIGILEETEPKSIEFKKIVLQLALMDTVFSLDSVLAAIGLSNHFLVMSIAISCAIVVMLYLSEPVGAFIEKHPSIKILALSFLILIGTILIADGCSFHIPRAYVYFAMGFSLAVECLNLRKRSNYSAKLK